MFSCCCCGWNCCCCFRNKVAGRGRLQCGTCNRFWRRGEQKKRERAKSLSDNTYRGFVSDTTRHKTAMRRLIGVREVHKIAVAALPFGGLHAARIAAPHPHVLFRSWLPRHIGAAIIRGLLLRTQCLPSRVYGLYICRTPRIPCASRIHTHRSVPVDLLLLPSARCLHSGAKQHMCMMRLTAATTLRSRLHVYRLSICLLAAAECDDAPYIR